MIIRIAILLLICTSVEARVTRIVVDSRSPAFASQSFGTVGPYEVLRGRAFGEVHPADRRNAIIQDIGLAPRNANGKVQYIATFTLLKPRDTAKANGVLLYSVPNRGGRILGDRAADDFRWRAGYFFLSSGWQGDLTPVPTADQTAVDIPIEAIALPRARNPDGSSITGPYVVRMPTLAPAGPSGQLARLDQGRGGALSYMPASLDTRKASLSFAPAESIDGAPTGNRTELSSTDWTWADCQTAVPATEATAAANLCIKLLKDHFDPAQVYTLAFTVKDPLVLGLGLAATRDIVSFFRHAQQDDSGERNPIFGAIKHVIGQGASQTGNFLKTFIHLGFNEDEAGRIVWDGANPHVAGRFAPINFRFAVPGGSASLYAPGSEAILWWGSAPDRARGKAVASMLDRCRATNTCPKIFETFSSSEFWNQRMSPGLAGTDGKQDIPLPPNVRRYYFPGTQHVGGQHGFHTGKLLSPQRQSNEATNAPASAGYLGEVLRREQKLTQACLLQQNPNSFQETRRALLVALTEWVVNDLTPPNSRYPTVSAGLLVADREHSLRFPSIPGVPKPYKLANPVLDYDFGPHFNSSDLSGYMDRQPPSIKQVLPVLVPQVDSDGNELAGAASVLHRAPLGTYLGWNVTQTGIFAGRICSFTGSFVPFANTRAQRLQTGDPRLSIEERYGSRRGYLCAVRKAVQQSIGERFLLEEDAQRLIQEATAATESGDLAFLPPSGTSRERAWCADAQTK